MSPEIFKWLSFVLGILSVVLIWLLFYASSKYDFTNTRQSYNNFFCSN